MAYIRGQERMVTQTARDYLVAQLTILGWFGAVGTLPFGAQTPLTVTEEMPKVDGTIADNTVAITEGPVNDDQPGELGASGGGLWLTKYTLFVDVFGESLGIARAIASDVRAVMTGKLAGTNRYQLLTDYSQSPATPTTALLEFQDVQLIRPESQLYQKSWMAVKATLELQFNGIEHS